MTTQETVGVSGIIEMLKRIGSKLEETNNDLKVIVIN